MDKRTVTLFKERLKDIYDEDGVVVIKSKRSFLPEYDNLYIKPSFKKKIDILGSMDTSKALNEFYRTAESIGSKCNNEDTNMEERISLGIVMDRKTYEDLCEKIQDLSSYEVLNTNILLDDEEFIKNGIVKVSPYFMDCQEENKQYAVVSPSYYVRFNEFCKEIENYGANLAIKVGDKDSNITSTSNEYYNILKNLLQEQNVEESGQIDLKVTMNAGIVHKQNKKYVRVRK